MAGLDIGSTTTKTVILDLTAKIVGYRIENDGVLNEAAPSACLHHAVEAAGTTLDELSFLVTTGYGRSLVEFGQKSITEISCDARGASFLHPGIRTVIDIGGQDSKAIAIDALGRTRSFAMNDKCAAGTGRFLEVIARALGVTLEDMGKLSLQSTSPASVSSICTVFAETEVVSLAAKGIPKVDIVAGIHEAICRRVIALVGQVGIVSPVMMVGGVAKNQGVLHALEVMLKTPVVKPEEPQIVAALGAALFALDEAKRPG